MEELEQQLIAAKEAGARHTLIVTDGVFSVDGVVASPFLLSVTLLTSDTSDGWWLSRSWLHGRKRRRYSRDSHNVVDRIDIITGTLAGKTAGGASGGYTSGKKKWSTGYVQRSRPYLFSNSVAPAIVSASIRVLDLLAESGDPTYSTMGKLCSLPYSHGSSWFHYGRCWSRNHPNHAWWCKMTEFAERALERHLHGRFLIPCSTKRPSARIRRNVCCTLVSSWISAIDAFIQVSKDMAII